MLDHELLKRLAPVHSGVEDSVNQSSHASRQLAHHLGSLCSLSHLDLPLSSLLRLVSSSALAIFEVHASTAGALAITIAVTVRQQVVDLLGHTATCGVEVLVEAATVDELADALVCQQLVDDIVSSHVPLLRVTGLTTEVVLQHGVHTLVSHEELELVICQIRHELGIVEHTLAIGAGSADALLVGVWHTQSDGPYERVLQYE